MVIHDIYTYPDAGLVKLVYHRLELANPGNGIVRRLGVIFFRNVKILWIVTPTIAVGWVGRGQRRAGTEVEYWHDLHMCNSEVDKVVDAGRTVLNPRAVFHHAEELAAFRRGNA